MDKEKEFSDHRIKLKFFVSEVIRNNGTKVGEKSRTEFEVKKGIIEENKWYEQAMELIQKYNEVHILEALKIYCKKHCAWLQSDDELYKYCVELHVSRIFENPEWLGYEEFRNSDKEMQVKLF